jgi:hypothetical protein
LLTSWTVLAINLSPLHAAVITTFQDALQPTTPAPGWAYLWNSAGTVGNPANYTALSPTTHSSYWYDNDGVSGLPGSNPGAYVYFGAGRSGHPGRGSSDVGAGGVERYAIAMYALESPGSTSIVDGLLTNTDGSTDGLNLKVFATNT